MTPKVYHIPAGDVKNQTIRVTSPFGLRDVTVAGRRFDGHSGVDLRSYNVPNGPQGACYAPTGVVVSKVLLPDPVWPDVSDSQRPAGRGWTPYVEMIDKSNGDVWLYMHLKSIVIVGEHLPAGTIVGYTDRNYGLSNGIHVHVELHRNGEKIDAVPVLVAGGVRVVDAAEFEREIMRGSHI